MELCDHTITRLNEMMDKGHVSALDVLESVFKRIEEKEPVLNCYITLTKDLAIEMAKESHMRRKKGQALSPLDGIPIGVKDNICTKGIRTTCGSKILFNYIPPYDATVMERLYSAGAVLVGKTNMDEFAMGSSCENSAFGPTRNPFSTDSVPGGSSGGSAAAVAAGEAIGAIGSDTGGSIRQPAAFCGVVGIKPTYGRVSRFGLVAYASSLDQIGPIAKSVRDCALLTGIISGHDPKDSTSVDAPVPDFMAYLSKSIKGLKIGLPKEYLVHGLDEGVAGIVQGVVSVLKDKGAELVEVSLPHTQYSIASYYLVATAEASSNLARYDGVKYGLRAQEEDLINMYEATRSTGFGKEVKRRVMLGTYVLSSGYYEAYYLKALKVRTLIKRDFEEAFQKVDVILAPVSPVPTFKLGERLTDPLSMYLVDIYTTPVNLAGLPAISVKGGMLQGLPVGVQFIGRPFDEGTLFQVAYTLERTLWGED